MRVLICDDSTLFRRGLALLLGDLGVGVGEVPDAAGLPSAVAHTPPDAVILDIRMPPTNTDEGLTAAARLRALHPRLGLLILSTYAETAYAVRVLRLGAGSGYLLKDRVGDAATLRDALERVARGETVVDPGIVERLLNRQRHADLLDQLTGRERGILAHIAEGRSNAAIARRLHLAPKTVEGHVTSLLGKLQLDETPDGNRRVLAVLAWLRGSDRPPP